ncbi:hypothetical protein SUGI_0946700 [Cryptomeria japonica]|nr:hypothetical protein SUGI_0946700 [Cryptomeria japonica]
MSSRKRSLNLQINFRDTCKTRQEPAMAETQTWTRRGSNPKLLEQEAIDIPPTPTGDGKYGAFPVSQTLTTVLIIAACFIAISWLEIVPMQFIVSRKQFLKILALSFIFSFSVVCGNTSLRYLPVSFNQAIGATTPFFTAIFAFVITCKRESSVVYMALVPVVFGIVIASNSEPLFHLFGFLVCLGSTAARALKSVVQGLLLTSEAEKLHSMNLLMYMAPIAALLLLPVTLFVEVTKHTSPLTLQVLGNAKAAVAAVISVLIFKNPVTVMGMTGFVITIMGVVLYSEAKKRFKAPH